MHTFLKNHLYSTTLIVLALALIVGAWMAHKGQERFSDALAVELVEQREIMRALAVVTDRNGADETLSKIVVDCPRRDAFEALLITLGTLPKQELLSAQALFESCGSFYPTQKALMVMRLEREYDEYVRLLELEATLIGGSPSSDERALWEELLSFEKTRSSLLTEQTELQGAIINELIKGFRPASTEVRELVSKAQEIAELLSVYDQRIDELRTKLGIA